MGTLKKNFYLTEFSKLEKVDKVLLITTIAPLFLVMFEKIYFIIFTTILLILTVYLGIKGNKSNIKTKLLKKNRFIMSLCYIGLLIYSLIDQNIIQLITFIFSFFAYLYNFGVLLSYLLNILFIYGLKTTFPKEGHKADERIEPNLKKLSEYIDLDTQKKYYSISLLNSFIYLCFIAFTMLLIIKKYVHSIKLEGLRSIALWSNKQEYLILFNAVSLFSLMLTIYTFTVPLQTKIIKDAKEKYYKNNDF